MRVAWRWWWGASVLVHSGLVAIGYAVMPHRAPGPAVPALVAFELPAPESPLPGDPARAVPTAPAPIELPGLNTPPPDPASLGGAHNAQNINTRASGERGDGRSLEAGHLLAERAEGVNLSPNLINTLRADQEHRLRTARDRTSPQDRRSTPNPGYDPWIALRDGVLLFRVPSAEQMPARGAVLAPGVARPAGASAAQPAALGDSAPPATLAPMGALPRPTAGIAAATTGRAPRVAGPSANGHASIEEGHASTTSDLADERPRDNTDAEALATTLLRNSLSATVHSGPTRAEGIGGVGGGGAAGSGGGEGTGGRARAYGEGDGYLSLNSPDERYLRYFQQVRRRLYPLWADAFPRDEMLRLRQGTVILTFVIQRDGRVRDVSVRRQSGVAQFDANVAAAIAGAQLPPIPPELERAELRISAPFQFRNPIVR